MLVTDPNDIDLRTASPVASMGKGWGMFERPVQEAMDSFFRITAMPMQAFTGALRHDDRFSRWRATRDSQYAKHGRSPAYEAFLGKWELTPFRALDFPSFVPAHMAPYANVVKAYLQEQMRDNPHWHVWMHSPQMVALHAFLGTVLPGRSALTTGPAPWNHQFLTEDSHGTIRPVRVEEIDALFPRGTAGADFPHIVMVPNHVIAESEKDIRELTHGVEALIRDSQGQKLPMARVNGQIEGLVGKTLVLFACDTERNPFLNSEALFNRLNELQALARSGKPAADRFEHISPGAKRMAGLILRQMAQNPNDVEVLSQEPYIKVHAEPLKLREHPERVAQHFQLIGYSKGGNVVSDAMRYLVSQLADAKGTPRVAMADGHTVRNLVRNIACMSIAALEVKMADYYKDLGVRRVSFNNKNDVVSNHMDFDSSWADHKWKIDGPTERLGHAPADALGTREGAPGYVLNDPAVRRVMKESFAPLYGKAAISSVVFRNHELLTDDHTVLFGTAAGTSDELLMQQAGKIKAAMEKAGLHHVRVEDPTAHNGRAFLIRADEPIRTSRTALLKLRAGFAELRAHTNGLVVADTVLQRNFAEQLKQCPYASQLDHRRAARAVKAKPTPNDAHYSVRAFADRVQPTADEPGMGR